MRIGAEHFLGIYGPMMPTQYRMASKTFIITLCWTRILFELSISAPSPS